MNRQQKEQAINVLQNDFSAATGTFVVGVKGLTVKQLQELRKNLRAQGAKLKITKARLMRIASKDKEVVSDLDKYFKDQVGVVFSSKESNGTAKVLYDFAKKNEALKLVAGCMDQQLFDAATLKQVAQLPSREVLLAQLCGVLQAPATQLVIVLDMLAKKLESGASTAQENQ